MSIFNFGRQRREAVTAGGSYSQRVVSCASPESALRVAAVYRAAELRANSIAALQMRLMRYNQEQRCFVTERGGTYGAENYVLQTRPNDRQNAFQFWKQVELMRIFHGHCYILPQVVDGQLLRLIPCSGSWDSHSNTYVLTNTAHGVNGVQLPADAVIVLRGVVTDSHPEGESVLRYAARTASVSATTEALTLESAAKGGRQKLIMRRKPDAGLLGLGGVAPEEMREQAQRLQEGIYNDDVIFDDSGSEITPINMSAADLQLLESRKFTVADIARFFGVPRALLMDDGNSHYNTAEAATLEFMSRTLMPIIREIECEFDSKLLTPSEWGKWQYRFDTSALLALDINAQAAYNKARLESGLASVNELRAEANMPAVDGGDDHYVSCNIAPLGCTKLSGDTNPDTDK